MRRVVTCFTTGSLRQRVLVLFTGGSDAPPNERKVSYAISNNIALNQLAAGLHPIANYRTSSFFQTILSTAFALCSGARCA